MKKAIKTIKNPTVIAIGLDGASWNVLLPMIKRNKLPTFKKLIKNGAWGHLKSCVPFVTSPAWKCLSTGKNPGKLGVYWWVIFDKKQKTFSIPYSTDFKSKDLWDYLSGNKLKCGIINMPLTYPPKPINGFVISGFPIGKKFTYPYILEEEIKKMGYKSPNMIPEFSKYKLLKENLEVIKQRFGISLKLFNKYKPNFLFLTLFSTNLIQRKFQKNKKIIELMWVLVDKEINKFISKVARRDAYLIIFSDHGSVETKAIFFINEWLKRNGYIKTKPSLVSLKSYIPSSLESWIGLVRRFLSPIIIPFRSLLSFRVSSKPINWGETTAYNLGWGIYIFDKTSNEKYETVRDSLMNQLRKIRDPKSKKKIFKWVKKREKVYEGDYVKYAPDIAFIPNEGYEFNYRFSKRCWDYSSQIEGTKCQNGLFIVNGPNVKKGKIKDAKIYDIAPTILQIFGINKPFDIDGKTLNIFK